MIRRLWSRIRGSALLGAAELAGFACLIGAAYLVAGAVGFLIALGISLIVAANGAAIQPGDRQQQ